MRGPKPKDPQDVRRHRVTIHLRDDEKDALLRKAGDRPLAVWLRDLGMAQPDAKKR